MFVQGEDNGRNQDGRAYISSVVECKFVYRMHPKSSHVKCTGATLRPSDQPSRMSESMLMSGRRIYMYREEEARLKVKSVGCTTYIWRANGQIDAEME